MQDDDVHTASRSEENVVHGISVYNKDNKLCKKEEYADAKQIQTTKAEFENTILQFEKYYREASFIATIFKS